MGSWAAMVKVQGEEEGPSRETSMDFYAARFGTGAEQMRASLSGTINPDEVMSSLAPVRPRLPAAANHAACGGH